MYWSTSTVQRRALHRRPRCRRLSKSMAIPHQPEVPPGRPLIVPIRSRPSCTEQNSHRNESNRGRSRTQIPVPKQGHRLPTLPSPTQRPAEYSCRQRPSIAQHRLLPLPAPIRTPRRRFQKYRCYCGRPTKTYAYTELAAPRLKTLSRLPLLLVAKAVCAPSAPHCHRARVFLVDVLDSLAALLSIQWPMQSQHTKKIVQSRYRNSRRLHS